MPRVGHGGLTQTNPSPVNPGPFRGEKVTQVVCEATGGYEDRVVEGLRAGEMAVYVAHPSRVRSFAQALGQGAKTDPLDAQVLALYGEVFEVEGQSEQDSASRELREVVGRRQQLVQQRVQELNRLEKGLIKTPIIGARQGGVRPFVHTPATAVVRCHQLSDH